MASSSNVSVPQGKVNSTEFDFSKIHSDRDRSKISSEVYEQVKKVVGEIEMEHVHLTDVEGDVHLLCYQDPITKHGRRGIAVTPSEVLSRGSTLSTYVKDVESIEIENDTVSFQTDSGVVRIEDVKGSVRPVLPGFVMQFFTSQDGDLYVATHRRFLAYKLRGEETISFQVRYNNQDLNDAFEEASGSKLEAFVDQLAVFASDSPFTGTLHVCHSNLDGRMIQNYGNCCFWINSSNMAVAEQVSRVKIGPVSGPGFYHYPEFNQAQACQFLLDGHCPGQGAAAPLLVQNDQTLIKLLPPRFSKAMDRLPDRYNFYEIFVAYCCNPSRTAEELGRPEYYPEGTSKGIPKLSGVAPYLLPQLAAALAERKLPFTSVMDKEDFLYSGYAKSKSDFSELLHDWFCHVAALLASLNPSWSQLAKLGEYVNTLLTDLEKVKSFCFNFQSGLRSPGAPPPTKEQHQQGWAKLMEEAAVPEHRRKKMEKNLELTASNLGVLTYNAVDSAYRSWVKRGKVGLLAMSIDNTLRSFLATNVNLPSIIQCIKLLPGYKC